MPWFLLYPALAAALGAGTAKVTSNDWKKGAMLGAGLGLGAGALAPAAAGGAGGWGALMGGSNAAGNAAANLSMAKAGIGGAEGLNAMQAAGALSPKTIGLGAAGQSAAGVAAKTAGWGQLAKQAAVSTALGTGVSAAMPKYGQTQLMVNPGFLQPMQEDPMMQLQQLMSKKGRVV